VLIVDDDPLVRAGLTMMLGGAEKIEVVGEAADGSEVLGALDRHRADVVLMDLRMPKLDGIAAMELVCAQPQPPAVLVLTTFDTDDQVLRALRRGAAGFLVKDTPPAEIVRAIELVAAGESMLSPTVTRRLIDRLAGDVDADVRHSEAAAMLGELSPRDRDIAAAIAKGKSNAAIAADLHLSIATIKSHVSAMLAKLQLDNRVQIALLVQDAERV
jgi:DNA-binding NarL/FixJ family response regulator